MKTYGTKYKYFIVIALGLVGFIVMFCQYQMQPMASEIKETLTLNDSQFSALFTAGMLPAIFISLVCGIIVDKVGGRWPMFICLCLGVAALWCRVYATTFGMMYVCMIAIGLAATFGNACNVKMFAGWFTPSQCGVCIGIYMALASIGCAAGTFTTPYLPSLTVAYVVSAIIITITAIFWFLFYRDWKEPEEKQEIIEEQKNTEPLLVSIKTVLKEKDMIIASIGDLCMYGGLMSLNTFLGLVLMDKGLETEEIGKVAALVTLGMFVGTVVIPMIVARIGKVRSTLFVSGLIGSAMILAVAFLPAGILLDIALTLCGFFLGGNVPVIMSLPIRIKEVGAERTATAGGIIATFQIFGAVVIPTYIIANIAGGNYTLVVIFCAVISFVGIFILRCLSAKVE